MRKWWRKFKNKHGWDFKKVSLGPRAVKVCKNNGKIISIADPNGCYVYVCRYCGLRIVFPWKEFPLAYHNMQRHIKAKHLDVL